MIIGISGRMGSGKDTVGKIIQYLSANNNLPNNMKFSNFKQFKEEDAHKDFYSEYQIKKFADKLKDIVCLLIGCTREQLEDREFKDKELGKEWTKNIFDGLYIIEEIDEETGEYVYSDQRGKELGNVVQGGKNSYKDFNITLTPRKLLQLLGTECGRQILHPNIWVNALFADYVCNDCGQKECPINEEDTGQMIHYSYPNWIITDVRFPNEANAVKERDGIMIRVNRPIPRIVGINYNLQDSTNEFVETKEHSSETSLDNYDKFDYVIENDGTIEELIEKVKNILIKEKIIK